MKKIKQLIAMFIAGVLLLAFSNKPSDLGYPEMILVSGGTFMMGDESVAGGSSKLPAPSASKPKSSEPLNEGSATELPTHSVTLKSFKIAKTETTVAQWRAFCNATGHSMPETPSWGWHDNDPIVNINWDDATAYCKWLTDNSGILYRLPTEAEYEYAARGGRQAKGFKYSGSNNIDDVCWYRANSGEHPHAVETKKANELGLFDMSGNVWAWCSDWYDGDYYHESPSENPQGPESGEHRVQRGGSWYNNPQHCRVASRGESAPDFRYYGYGVRVACSE